MADIIKLSENEWVKFFCSKWLNPIGRIQDGCHHQINQNELVSVRVLCTMAESKMANFKKAAIIKLIRLHYFQSESEWSESVFEWIWEKITRCLNPRWQCLNPTWQNSRWRSSSSWVRMKEWIVFVHNGWIQDGKIQDSCHHQINQIELVWVRVGVEWEFFWVNLREDNKVSESKMAVS